MYKSLSQYRKHPSLNPTHENEGGKIGKGSNYLLKVAFLVAVSRWGIAADSFPYTGYVHSQTAAIRSGPGSEFYVTDRLIWGAKVEVHRHDDGWCAIRPPEGSFSWVKKEGLQTTETTGVARVRGKRVLSYIGSRYGDSHDISTVQLSDGELVKVLGSKRRPATKDAPEQLWCKVSPPAGEFRWIRLSQVSRVPPDHVADQVEAIMPILADERRVIASQTVRDAASPDENVNPKVDIRDLARSKVDRRAVSLMELELCRIVANDPHTWVLTELQQRARYMIDTSGDAAVRHRAQRLLSKLVQFADIKRRHKFLEPPARSDPAHRLDQQLPAPMVVGSGAARMTMDYDGRGWLMPVIAQRPGIPRHALTDRNGQIIQFVSPSPGVNLRRFERQEVGVIGQPGYMSQLRLPHLTAQRVVVLDRHRR